ncbi:MAG: hypothetical protein O9293_13340 [Porphyrobacter sp.]|nr:hypothetical protein [Porphyrobacter sp.]
MTEILFFFLVTICAWLLWAAVYNLRKFCEFPTLIAALYAGFVLPQAHQLLKDPAAPQDDLSKVLVIAIGLLGATILGWRLAAFQRGKLTFAVYNETQLRWAVVGASLVGAIFSIWLRRLPSELTGVSQWTGVPTILYFFSKFQILAFAISLLCYLRSYDRNFLYWALFNAAFIVPAALLDARRESTVEIALIVIIAGWFARRQLPSRLILLGGGAVAAILVSSISQVRRIIFQTNEDGIRVRGTFSVEELLKIDPFASDVMPLYTELGNAVRVVGAVDASGGHTWGLRIWDTFVFNYVPGQWLGYETKRSLQIFDQGVPQSANVKTDLGTVITAFADTFEAFGYAAPLIYLIVGFAYGWLFRLAMAGSLFHQYFYLIALSAGLISITHGFLVFPARLPALVVFSLFIFGFLKRRRIAIGRRSHSVRP